MKKLAILMSAIMLVAFTTGVSMAAQKAVKVQTQTGQVVKVDPAAGNMMIKVGQRHETLKADKTMLAGITPGERVKIEKTGSTVKSIKKIYTPIKMKPPKSK